MFFIIIIFYRVHKFYFSDISEVRVKNYNNTTEGAEDDSFESYSDYFDIPGYSEIRQDFGKYHNNIFKIVTEAKNLYDKYKFAIDPNVTDLLMDKMDEFLLHFNLFFIS